MQAKFEISNGLDRTHVSLFRRWEWNQFDNDGSRTNNHNEAYNGKLEKIINKPHPSIWEFVEKIQSEDTHYKLAYYRLISPNLQSKKGFAVRNRTVEDINKDLELANLKNRYLRHEFDAVEYNRRCAFQTHDYGELVKKKRST